MAGHSKWKNIRLRKGKQDAIRGKLFTKLAREIIVAAKAGGPDPALNPRLRVVVEKAREVSMPLDNIKRAIQRGTGEIEGADYEELVYEGYGPGGSAVIVEVYSENKNRTVADLRHAFSKNGGNLSESGSVAWQFKHLGQILIAKNGIDEDDVTLKALEAGAEDVVVEDENFVIFTPIEGLHEAAGQLQSMGFKTEEVGLTRVPSNMAELSMGDMRRLVKLLDALEELDDVQETFVNVEISEEVLQEA